ncbi:type II secretion system F family protein [Corynebacterium otitidis]
MSAALVLLAAALVVGAPPRPGARLGPRRPRAGPRPAAAGSGRLAAEEAAGDLEVYAACAAAGLPPAACAAVTAQAAGRHRGAWRRVAGLLALGVEAERAFAPARAVEGLAEFAAVLVASGESGVSVAEPARRVAERLRGQARARSAARAERAGVLIAAPLTACFLPAFFLLGLAPVLVGLAREMLA